MKNKLLKDAAALALSGLDRQSASQVAETIASAVGRREGHRGLKMVADLVAQGLSASAQQSSPLARQSNQLAPRNSRPNSTERSDGAGAAGWQQALRMLQAGRAEDSDPSPQKGSQAQSPSATASATPDQARPVSRATLAGTFDAANVGGFTFSLMRSQQNVQLSVGQLNAPGNVGGLFSLESLPPSTWARLDDRLGRRLPVWVLVEGETVDLLVGDGPQDAKALRAVDGRGRAQ